MASNSERRSSDGFTLIELLVVFVVIGILASIALDVFLNQRRKGWDAAVESDLRNAATAQETVLVGTSLGVYATDIAQLQSVGFRPSPRENYFGKAFALTLATDGGKSFCITARSESGRYFGYGSSRGLVSKQGPLDVNACD